MTLFKNLYKSFGAFMSQAIGSMFEIKSLAPILIRKPHGYGRPVSEILYARKRH